MEFDEIKKVWDAQNNEPLYVINETTLHNRILSKKKQAHHITNISELLSVVAYSGTGCFILGMNVYKQSGSIFMYILAGWMIISALYLLVSRIRRIQGNRRFDLSMRGDLAHAISMATYQVNLSRLMRWNVLPIGILTGLGVWDGGKSIWGAVGILVFFILANYASGWEHRIYKARKHALEKLQDKLENEDPGDRAPWLQTT
ncbi:MAG: hypothetical protein JWP81_1056 [Ferruginibacter sp.]|nr:hypothetical protein [Ferruginibacter sp.]